MGLDEVEALSGTDDLSSDIPVWFYPVYCTLISLIALLAIIVKSGPSGRTAESSAVSLVLLDSLTMAIVPLTAVLLVVAVSFGHPWRTISFTSLGPLGMFLAAIVFARVSNIRRRKFLNLWIRLASVVSITDMRTEYPVLIQLSKILRHQRTNSDERDVLELLKADTLGGISAAPYGKGSSWPFLSALKMWWKQGTPDSIPSVLTIRRSNGIPRPVLLKRHVNHSAALRTLMRVAQAHLERQGYRPLEAFVNLRIVTSFDQSVGTVMHERFGFIWHRVTSSSCISRNDEGWWFMGAEVVQTLKAICGIQFISGRGYWDNVSLAWEWAANFYHWRKPFQVAPVAVELARNHMEDPEIVTDYGLGLAGEGKKSCVPKEGELHLAIEANIIACLGLVVSAIHTNLEERLPALIASLVEILEQQENAIVVRDCSGCAAVIAVPSDCWPERELAVMVVEWILAGCEEPKGRGC